MGNRRSEQVFGVVPWSTLWSTDLGARYAHIPRIIIRVNQSRVEAL
ncbi:hypothetical protein ABH935_009912 [Catenulispora sp. GAS73]